MYFMYVLMVELVVHPPYVLLFAYMFHCSVMCHIFILVSSHCITVLFSLNINRICKLTSL